MCKYYLKGIFPALLFPCLLSFGQSDAGVQDKGIRPPQNDQSKNKIVEGNTYAVIVGIDHYTSQRIPSLLYAAEDAKAFKEFLQSKAGGEVSEENIRMFLNDSASTGKFKKLGLSWLKLKAKKGDRVYLFFSGHGITVSGGDSYFLASNLASDFSVEDIEEAGTQPLYQLKTNTIRPLCNNGVQVIFIMDACRSHLADSLKSETVQVFDPIFNSAEMNAGDITFLSSSNGQVSIETSQNNIKHGLFSYYLLKGLYGFADNGKKPDGIITVNKIKNYVTRMVSDFTEEKQIPKVEYSGTDNPVITYVDSNLFAVQKKKFNNDERENDFAINSKEPFSNEKASSESLPSDTLNIYNKLLICLDQGLVWGNNGALYWFEKLKKDYKYSTIVKEAALNIMASLLDSGQFIINSYLSANKKIFRNQGKQFDYLFSKGAMIFDTLYKINKMYFPGDNDNKYYLKQYYFMKGRSLFNSYYKSDKTEENEGLAYLNKAYQLDSTDMNVVHCIAIVLGSQKKYELAIKYEKKVLKKYPRWSYATNAMGNYLYYLRRYNEAIMYYEKTIRIDSLYVAPLNNIASYYLDILREYEISIKYFKKGLSLDSNSTLTWQFLGDAYYRLKNYDSAFYCTYKGNSIDSNFAFGWVNLGNIYYDLKKYDSAIYYSRKAIAIDSDYSDPWITQANVYYDFKNYDSTIYYCRKALEIDSGYFYAWRKLGYSWMAKNKSDIQALNCFKKVTQLFPDSFEGYYGLACFYSLNSDKKAALENFEKALQLGLTKGRLYEDSNIDFIRKTPGFKKLVLQYPSGK